MLSTYKAYRSSDDTYACHYRSGILRGHPTASHRINLSWERVLCRSRLHGACACVFGKPSCPVSNDMPQRAESLHSRKHSSTENSPWHQSENPITAFGIGNTSVDVTFRTELVGILIFVSPLNIAFFILPVPRINQHNVTLLNPDAVLHATRNTAHTPFTVFTSQLDVVAAIVFCDYCEQFVVAGHTEILPPRFFAHIFITSGSRVNHPGQPVPCVARPASRYPV